MEIGALVVDSSAVFKCAPLEKWSSNLFTVKEAVSEIKDFHTRNKLQVLQYELKCREPTVEALRWVTAFAKRTGDYTALSSTDLKLIALTYQLECELGEQKGTHLRKEPVKPQVMATRPSGGDLGGEGGGHSQPHPKQVESGQQTASPPLEQEDASLAESKDAHIEPPHSDGGVRECVVEEEMIREKEGGEKMMTVGGSEGEKVDGGIDVEKEADIGMAGKYAMNDIGMDKSSEEEGSQDEEEEEEGWITPDNLQRVCEQMGGVLEEEPKGIAVGCLTSDFAMQNVMLQMGLNVISVEGLKIKQLRTYALQCKACYKVTSKTTDVFCPSCGNKMLMKVTVTVDAQGNILYQPLSVKQFSRKGLRYSLPLPAGGRHANNPILAPDQRVTTKDRHKRVTRISPLDPDYIAQSSPFAMWDVNSRGARLAFASSGGHGNKRRNPNEVRGKGKRK
ncbi:hypothetical protein EMCRGX_G030981 [Ephydatia muelleri]